MKKLLLILFLLVIQVSIYGQSKSRIGIKLIPGITDSHTPFEEVNFNNNLHPRFTFNFGVQYIYQIKDSLLFIETGLYRSDRGCLQKDFTAQYSYLPDDDKTFDIYIHSRFLSLPLLLRVEHKFLFGSIGILADYYLNTKSVIKGDTNMVENFSYKPDGFFNNVKLGAAINIGYQFKPSERINIFVEGYLSPTTFKKDKINNKYYYYWNYGLGIGANFRL